MEAIALDTSSHVSHYHHDTEDHSYSTGRRRVSRACDSCHQSRRRCDGQQPCSCCVQTKRHCQYERQQKRRGRLSKMRQSAHGSLQKSHQESNTSYSYDTDATRVPDSILVEHDNITASLDGYQTHGGTEPFYQDLDISQNDFGYGMCDFLEEWPIETPDTPAVATTRETPLPTSHAPIEKRPVDAAPKVTQTRDMRLSWSGRTGRQPAARSNAERETRPRGNSRRDQEDQANETYPVLEPLLPELRKIMSDSLSFDLLRAYFEINPLKGSPKISLVPCSVLDKESFLTRKNPRRTSNVLLASMLWLSAQEADIPLLQSNVAKRKDIRRRLLRLTTQLLKPLSEVAFVGYVGEMHSQYFDECMAYVHLAMVTSASAFKRASLRWWNMAFSLAREINLHLPTDILSTGDTPPASSTSSLISDADQLAEGSNDRLAERVEAGKERARAWWFLYTMDRHISLLFNKPLYLLDSECSNLERFPNETLEETDLNGSLSPSSPTGPSYVCTGSHFFQFFTPLSSLLGEIVYFTQARNHPRFGISPVSMEDWSNWHDAIQTRLCDFQRSLDILRPTSAEEKVNGTLHAESNTIDHAVPYDRQVTHAYGDFFVHVLHVLLAGRWDPLAVLDQDESVFSSAQYQDVLEHALSSANALQKAMELDPGLQFMPFYLGIYLFQASLPFLCVADRIGAKTDEHTIKACQVLIHGLEVSTSQTSCEYQTAMVTALRIALLEMQGRVVDTNGENRLQRRRLLRKFDWTAEGRGAGC